MPILVKLSTGAKPASFKDKRVNQIKLRRISFGRLDQENHLIFVAVIESILQERGQDGSDIPVTALAQPFDDRLLVGKRSFAQLPDRDSGRLRRPTFGRRVRRRPSRRAVAAGAATARPAGGETSLVVLSGTLLCHLVVVPALQGHPIRVDVLAARKKIRPGVTRHGAGRLPHHVELTVCTHLSDAERAW